MNTERKRVFNWRVILNYIRRKIGEGLNRGKELAAASAVGVVILVLTIAGLPPFSTVMTLGETALERLAQAGFTGATAESNMRELATKKREILLPCVTGDPL